MHSTDRQNIRDMGYWKLDTDREYDYIYILITTKKISCGYRLGYFIGVSGKEKKILGEYDCGRFKLSGEHYMYINFDFECQPKGLKIWSNYGKLGYKYGGEIFLHRERDPLIK